MKENYLITIRNTQMSADGKQEYSLSTVGDYIFEGDRRTIHYTDSAATGFEGCETTLHISPGFIRLHRTGESESELLLEAGKHHMCHYGTPIGDLTVGVRTEKIDDRLQESGGTIRFSYSLDLNSGFFAANDLKITVREKKKSHDS